MALITRPDAARELGVTVQSVYAAIKTGRLSAVQTDDGKILIDNRTMKKEWKSKTAKKLGNKFKEDKPTYVFPLKPTSSISKTRESIPDYEESRARTEHLKAELLELDRQQKQGLLVPVAEVRLKWIEVITMARTKVMGLPTKAKQRIPELDVTAMDHLDEIVREALEDLAESQAA